MIYVKIENDYCNGDYSNTPQPTWETVEVKSLPTEDLRFYKVVNNELVYDESRKKQILSSEELSEEMIALQEYLTSTDWYAIRFADTGEPIPESVRTKRADARVRISEIRELL